MVHRVKAVDANAGTGIQKPVTLLHLAPLIRKSLLEKENVMNNMYVDARIHGIKNVNLAYQTYEADLKIEVHWTDNTEKTRAREQECQYGRPGT